MSEALAEAVGELATAIKDLAEAVRETREGTYRQVTFEDSRHDRADLIDETTVSAEPIYEGDPIPPTGRTLRNDDDYDPPHHRTINDLPW